MSDSNVENVPNVGQTERSLVTIALLSYNQKEYIREAVKGVLEQDYSPLQIIISDDCSTDGTFAIIEDILAKYNGPHDVLLNRNECNFGIGKHINTVMALVNGVLVIVAAGDDISIPTRASILTRSWLSDGGKCDSLYSDYFEVGANGKSSGARRAENWKSLNVESMAQYGYGILGATGAWTMRLWKEYGGLPANAVHEDQIIPFRAALSGGIKYVDKPLVHYRINVSTWTDSFNTSDEREIQARMARLYTNGLVTAVAGMADVIKKGRLDLLPVLSHRLATYRMAAMIYRREASFGIALWDVLSLGAHSNTILRSLIKCRLPMIHRLILRLRRGSNNR